MENKRGGTYCAAQTCNACSKGNPGLSFYTFPKDPSRCKVWVQNVGRQDLEEKDLSALARSYRLCASHFEPHMFMNQNDRKRLVWNAIPTIFEPEYHNKKTNSDKKITQAPMQCIKESQVVTATCPGETSSCQSSSFAPSEDNGDEKNDPSSERKENGEMVVAHPKQYHNYCRSPTDKTDGSTSFSGCHDYAKDPLLKSATSCHDYSKTGSIADDNHKKESKGIKDECSAQKSEDVPTQEQIEQVVNLEEASMTEKLESLQKAVSPLLKRGKIKNVMTIDRGKVKSVLDVSSGRVKTVTGAKDLKTITPILCQGKIKKIMAVQTDQIASIVKKISANQLTVDGSLIKVKHRKLLGKSSDHVKIMNARNLGSLSFPVPEGTLSKSKSSSVKNENSRNVIPLSSPLSIGDTLTSKSTPALQKCKSFLSEDDIKSKKLIPEAGNIFTRNTGVQTSPLVTFEKHFLDKERLKKYTRLVQKHKQRTCRLKKKYDNLLGKVAGLKDVGKPTQILKDSSKYLNDYQLLLLGCQLYMSSVQLNGRRYSSMIEGVVNRVFYNHPIAYNFLSKILPLPPDRAVKSWMRTAAKGPGFHQDIFELLKERMEKTEDGNNVCTLQFSGIPIDSKLEQEDDGNFAVVTKALCIMVRGIKTEWTQLISYFLLRDETCMVDILYNIVTNCLWELYKINVKVKAVVCDESDITRALYQKFGAHPEAPYFFQGGSRIHCLYNPTQLLICTRDALKNHNILVEKRMAKWEHINEFYQKDIKMKIRLAPQLSCQNIAARDRVKTGVKMAAQTMSRTVASGLCTHASLASLPSEAMDTANFIKKIDQLFDLFNSQPENGNKKFQRGFQGDQTQMAFLKDTVEWISKWQAVGAVGRTRSQEGWLQTITGLTGLWEDLKNQHNFKILFTRRLNLDSMDAFFDLVRRKSLLEKKQYPTAKHIMDSFRHAAVTSLKQIAYDDQCFEDLARKIMENCAQSHNDNHNGHMPPSDSTCVTQKTLVMNNADKTCVNMETSHSHEPVLSSGIQVKRELITVSQNECENPHCIRTSVETSDPWDTGDLLQRQNANDICATKADTKYTDFPSITVDSSENAFGESIPVINEVLAVVTSPSHVSNVISDLKCHRVSSHHSKDLSYVTSENSQLRSADQPDTSIKSKPLELFRANVPACLQSNSSSQPHNTDDAVSITEPLDFAISESSHPADNVNTEQKYDTSKLNQAALVTSEKTTEKIMSLLSSHGEPTVADTIPLAAAHETIAQASPTANLGEIILSPVYDIPVSSRSSKGNHHMCDAGDEKDISLTKAKKIWGVRKRTGSQRSIKTAKERKKLLQGLIKMLKVMYKT